MRETKDQTIERLKKEVDEQKSELTKVKKDRKRLNYAVEKMKRQMQKLSSQSSTEDIEKIKELEQLIEEQKSTIAEKENEKQKMEKRLYQTIEDKDFHYDNLMKRYNTVREEVKAEYDGYVDEALKKIAKFRNYQNNYYIYSRNLSAYESGAKYYMIKENGEEHEYPMFSTSDLFIQIHPKTGVPLTDIHFKLFKEWSWGNLDYLQYYSPYEECLNEVKMVADTEIIVSSAYKLKKYYHIMSICYSDRCYP